MSKAQDKILDAARRCFREQGILQTNVLDIVNAAGVGRTTFYRQFRDLDDILVTLAARILTDSLPALTGELESTAGNARQRWRDFIAAIVQIGLRGSEDPLHAEVTYLRVIRLFYGNYGDKLRLLVEALAPLIDRAKTRGELRTDIASERIAEWLLRQAWALTSLPLSGRWQHSELDDYIDTFLLPSLLRPEGDGSTMQRLGDEVQRLAAIVNRLEAHTD